MDEMKIPPVGKPGNNVPNISGKGYFSAIQALPLALTSVIGPREAAEQEEMFTVLAALKKAAKDAKKVKRK